LLGGGKAAMIVIHDNNLSIEGDEKKKSVTSVSSVAIINFIVAPHDAGHHPETIKINKSLCGVPRGGFFRKSPLAAGGIFLFSW
jgi:hypothetical protein